jgi:UDP-N-acetylglucosamine 2-epimerase (non-hydrolysing)
MRIVIIAGARPNFVKIAPLIHEMRKHESIVPVLIHTGQHYDYAMSDRFFEDLEIGPPDVNLGVGSGSHATQTALVMQRLEPALETIRPDYLIVVGDVNSAFAAALTAVKLGIPIAHVEAGLRSFDRTMPEEINRLLTDSISDLLFVTEESGRLNLLREGIGPRKIHMVGNVMIDALEATRPRWEASTIHQRLGIEEGAPYALLTLHRPSNVDSDGSLDRLLEALRQIASRLPIILPVHPRTRPNLQHHQELTWMTGQPSSLPSSGILCIEPLGYLECIALMSRARLVLTDSGGVQEETTVLGVPCLTLRRSTERPVTVTHGTNRVVGTDPSRILEAATRSLANPTAPLMRPPLWDGHAAERIVSVLLEHRNAGNISFAAA